MDVCLILIIQGFFIYNNLICIKIDGKKKDEWGCKERRTESLCQAGSLPEDIISNTTCKGFIKLVHRFYVVCLLDCEQWLSSARKSVSESIWAAKSLELWEPNLNMLLKLTDFRAKERLLAVYMSFSVCKLFCCFLTGWIEGTIILAIMNSLLRCLDDMPRNW